MFLSGASEARRLVTMSIKTRERNKGFEVGAAGNGIATFSDTTTSEQKQAVSCDFRDLKRNLFVLNGLSFKNRCNNVDASQNMCHLFT